MGRSAVTVSFLSRNVVAQLGFTVTTNYLLMLFGLVTGTLAARILGPEGRGEWAAIQVWTLFLISFGCLGLPDALVYFVAREPNNRAKYVWTWWVVLIPLSILLVIAGYVIIPHALNSQSATTIAYAKAFLFLIPIEFVASAHYALQGSQDFFRWNIVRLTKPALYVCLLVGMWTLGWDGVGVVVTGYFVITIISLTVTLWLINGAQDILQFSPQLSAIRPMFRYGLQVILAVAPRRLNLKMDQLIMAGLIAPNQLGLYAAAVTWSLSAGSVASALGNVALPKVATGSDMSRRHRFAQMTRIVVLISILAAIPLYVVTRAAMTTLFGQDFVDAVPVAQVLVIASIPWYISSVLEDGLRGLGLPLVTAWAEALGLVVTAGLLAILLTQFGIMGAAIASVVAYWTVCFFLVAYLSFRLKFGLRDLLLIHRSDILYLWHKLVPQRSVAQP